MARRVRAPSIRLTLQRFSPSAAPKRHGWRPDYRAAWQAHAARWVVLVEATEADVAEALRDDPAVLGYCGARVRRAALTLQKTAQRRRRRGANRADLQRAEASLELQNDAGRLAIDCARKAGPLIPELFPAGKPKKTLHRVTLRDVGFSRVESHRWQRLGAIPDEAVHL